MGAILGRKSDARNASRLASWLPRTAFSCVVGRNFSTFSELSPFAGDLNASSGEKKRRGKYTLFGARDAREVSAFFRILSFLLGDDETV